VSKVIKKDKPSTYQYKSRFGTHKDMLIGEPDSDGNVKAKDEYGEYDTNIKYVDSGTPDWNRCNGKRLEGKIL